MGKNFRETLNQRLQNPEFKSEWDAMEPEYQIIKAMLDDCEVKPPLTDKDAIRALFAKRLGKK